MAATSLLPAGRVRALQPKPPRAPPDLSTFIALDAMPRARGNPHTLESWSLGVPW